MAIGFSSNRGAKRRPRVTTNEDPRPFDFSLGPRHDRVRGLRHRTLERRDTQHLFPSDPQPLWLVGHDSRGHGKYNANEPTWGNTHWIKGPRISGAPTGSAGHTRPFSVLVSMGRGDLGHVRDLRSLSHYPMSVFPPPTSIDVDQQSLPGV